MTPYSPGSNRRFDLVVLGSGAAGLTAALHSFPLKVLVVTKAASLESGSTPWAQGGISFPVNNDDIESHIQDTLISGAGLCRPEAVRVLVEEALQAQDWLEALGYPYDRRQGAGPGSGQESFLRGREGGHSCPRILHAGGDASGRHLSRILVEKVKSLGHITFLTGAAVIKLHQKENVITGLTLWREKTGMETISTPRIILAGGGIGQLFGRTSNPKESTGDALALGAEAGARTELLEMVQFHPTGLDVPEKDHQPLLTEALRGAGAKLVLEDGSPLEVDHPQGILGTRDAVSRAVFQAKVQGKKVYMDARQNPGAEITLRFPSVFALTKEAGLDPRKDLLPVTPVVHYHMGGLVTDLWGRTNIHGLWAAGECASTGVHGANRLASNSLLECLVFGRRAGLSAAAYQPLETGRIPDLLEPEEKTNLGLGEIFRLKKRIQAVVFKAAGPVRTTEGLKEGLKDLEVMNAKAGPGLGEGAHPLEERELKSLALLGPMVLKAALDRKESVGAHFRR